MNHSLQEKAAGVKGPRQTLLGVKANHYFFFSTINKIATQKQKRPEAPFLLLPRVDPSACFPQQLLSKDQYYHLLMPTYFCSNISTFHTVSIAHCQYYFPIC